MLSKKSRHMSSLANFGSRHLIEPAFRRRACEILVITGSNLDEAIGFHQGEAIWGQPTADAVLVVPVTDLTVYQMPVENHMIKKLCVSVKKSKL